MQTFYWDLLELCILPQMSKLTHGTFSHSPGVQKDNGQLSSLEMRPWTTSYTLELYAARSPSSAADLRNKRTGGNSEFN